MTKKTAKTTSTQATPSTTIPFGQSDWHISLPGSAFFDQELWEVIYNKLMKAPVKDIQVLLWLSKLGSSINNIAKSLVSLRDELAQSVWFNLTDLQGNLTPEALNSAEYQEKSKKFGEALNEHIFSKTIDLAPLGPLTLDLNNPDWHARSFIEGSSLSADDIMKLSESGIIIVKEPADAPAEEGTPAEKETPTEEKKSNEEKTDGADDILVPNDKE